MSENDEESWGTTIGKTGGSFLRDLFSGGKEGITGEGEKKKSSSSKRTAKSDIPPPPGVDASEFNKSFQREAVKPEKKIEEDEEPGFFEKYVGVGGGLAGLVGAVLAWKFSDSNSGLLSQGSNALMGAVGMVILAALVKQFAPNLIPGMGDDGPTMEPA